MDMHENYDAVIESQLRVGDEVILQRRLFDYKTGAPCGSHYYRTIVGKHNTVSGERYHLVNEPNTEWPEFAPWAGRWVYAGNSGIEQMWRRKTSCAF